MPEDVDEGLLAIRIAEVLNVPAPEVRHLSPVWIRDALIRLRVDRLQQERAAKKAQAHRKRSATAPQRER